LESVISHPSFQLNTLIANSVTHISDEFEPIKVVFYGHIGTYIRVHVLFITNYVKYITNVFLALSLQCLLTHNIRWLCIETEIHSFPKCSRNTCLNDWLTGQRNYQNFENLFANTNPDMINKHMHVSVKYTLANICSNTLL